MQILQASNEDEETYCNRLHELPTACMSSYYAPYNCCEGELIVSVCMSYLLLAYLHTMHLTTAMKESYCNCLHELPTACMSSYYAPYNCCEGELIVTVSA